MKSFTINLVVTKGKLVNLGLCNVSRDNKYVQEEIDRGMQSLAYPGYAMTLPWQKLGL
jgi:hypothetical protein